jgi:hypothetical protein
MPLSSGSVNYTVLSQRSGKKAICEVVKVTPGSPALDASIGLAISLAQRDECVDQRMAGNSMQIETKYLRLRGPVTLGSRFDDWRVCWLGGWAKHRMYYLVMLVRVKP